MAYGILPIQNLRAAVGQWILPSTSLAAGQLQPASLDLRLGAVAYRVRASFLPGSEASVVDAMQPYHLHTLDLSQGAVLEKGCVYLVPLQEALALPTHISALANAKSSTGRVDVFTRLITDGATAFDAVRVGYAGPLYAEIAPKAFSVLVRTGSRLNQIRFRDTSTAPTTPAELSQCLQTAHQQHPLVNVPLQSEDFVRGIPFSVDL
mgnify:CR=1 FL=1